MKKILASLFLICLAVFQIQAKYVARPVLESTTTEAALKSMLVMDQAWVPYPAYADRAGWEALLGKDRGTIIAQGENYLDFEWIAVKAEYYLAYARNGNRTLMQ
ncbi:MAG: heparinase, partial [Bacteroidales bacterium]|nr:heparinase [Bacteroidales bacterium]